MAKRISLQSPEHRFGPLFRAVQLGKVFPDSKTFVDSVPRQPPAEIVALYEAEKEKAGFDLKAFVHEHFIVPELTADGYVSDTSLTTAEHINRLWNRLTRLADPPADGGSRVPLPHPYVVPGGRFREIFYWDSYFTMLGLKQAGRTDLIRSMIDNFAYLIDRFGFIPNGNRTYFLTRSQPPFFVLMVQLLAQIDGPGALVQYLPQLQQEYAFWMNRRSALTPERPMRERVVQVPGYGVLNRYWDETPTPRPEAYRVEHQYSEEARKAGGDHEMMHRHLRAACEGGWDFSSRWCNEENNIISTRTADLVPVDLTCLLYKLEDTLAKTYQQSNMPEKAQAFVRLAADRKRALANLFWNEDTGFFHDYDALAGQLTPNLTLAGVFPLFVQLATPEQAQRVHDCLKARFLQTGGWVTTLHQSGQQWDWPNGWAPLQWIVYRGLMNYGFADTAREGRNRWLALNDKVFKGTGKMTEKYNVVDAALSTGGGNYPNQDGFGWTNGVYLALLSEQANEH